MPIAIPSPEVRPDFYSLREFAALFSRERRWTKRLIEKGEIKAVKISGTGEQLWVPNDQIEVALAQK
jgi:hypothetical protein